MRSFCCSFFLCRIMPSANKDTWILLLYSYPFIFFSWLITLAMFWSTVLNRTGDNGVLFPILMEMFHFFSFYHDVGWGCIIDNLYYVETWFLNFYSLQGFQSWRDGGFCQRHFLCLLITWFPPLSTFLWYICWYIRCLWNETNSIVMNDLFDACMKLVCKCFIGTFVSILNRGYWSIFVPVLKKQYKWFI